MAHSEVYKIYFATTPKLGITPTGCEHPVWVILLEHPDGETVYWYYTNGGPHMMVPYQHRFMRDPQTLPNRWTSKYLGKVPEEELTRFNCAFYRTIPGQNQYFAVRFMYELANLGFVSLLDVNRVRNVATYGRIEAEYFLDYISDLDHKLLDIFSESPVRNDFGEHLIPCRG